MSTWLLIVVMVAFLSTPALAACPNRCSRNGHCSNGVCVCDDMWTGGDCSLRKCPADLAWVGAGARSRQAECSDAGTCNRATGQCQCQTGYTGMACQNMACPASCRLYGRCQSMSEVSDGAYALWDAHRSFGCVCDSGRTGYDCTHRECPKGDDPRTTGQVDEIQVIDCAVASQTGQFAIGYGGKFTGYLATTDTAATIESSLESLTTLRDVSVSFTPSGAGACTVAGNSIAVTFLTEHGDLESLEFWTSSGFGGASFTLEAVDKGAYGTLPDAVTGTKEWAECSNRGACNHLTGECTCHSGFGPSDGKGAAGSYRDCGEETSAPTSCSNSCNGHGECDGTTYACACHEGYTGGDCSLRTCRRSRPWWGADHSGTAECSAKGLCDRTTGLCVCQPGFSGAACERSLCPFSGGRMCGGRGRCMSNRIIEAYAKVNGASAPGRYGEEWTSGSPATDLHDAEWDADMLYGCLCGSQKTDDGFFNFTGHDCSVRRCARGANPQLDGDPEIQTVRCTGTQGTVSLTFRDETATFAYDAPATGQHADLAGTATATMGELDVVTSVDLSATLVVGDEIEFMQGGYSSTVRFVDSVAGTTVTLTEQWGLATAPNYEMRRRIVSVKDALESLGEIDVVDVSFDAGSEACAAGGVDIGVTFRSETGDLPMMTGSASHSTIVVMETQKGTLADAECSDMGMCNVATGACECFDGYRSSDGYGNKGSLGECGAKDAVATYVHNIPVSTP
jgi:hypothetical protein